MSPLKYSIFLGAALLLSACADDMLRTDAYDDGSISFSVDQANPSLSSRGGGDKPSLSYLQSIKLSEEGEDPLYLHLESAENPATYKPSTRALPVSLDNLQEFKVTALLTDGQKKFIDNMTVVKQSDNSWLPATKYYWPQDDALTFLCQPTDPALPSTALSNLTMTSNKTFTFYYEVPFSEDKLHDADEQKDFILAINTYTKATAANGVAEINFKHPLTGICFVEDESLNKESLHIRKIEISGLYGKGSCEFTGNAVSTAASTWKKEGSNNNTYTQEIDADNNQIDVPVYTSDNVTAVAKPFMVLPHKNNELSNFKVKVTLANGNEYEKSLSEVSSLDPGRMYVFRLSNSDALYPPVENLQGMAGNGRLSLKWEEPILPADFTNIHQCGVKIEIDQENSENHSKAKTISTDLIWDGNDNLFPDDIKDLPYYAELMEIKDKDGNPQKIDTKNYDTFTCHVYALYYNSDHEGYNKNRNQNTAKIQESYARTITIKPEITSEDKVFFYIPEGAGIPEGLKDDDDVAAWDWFDKTFQRTDDKKYITYSTLEDLIKNNVKNNANLDGYVIWVPCGVQLRGGDDFKYTTYDSGAETKLKAVNNILQQNPLPDYLTQMGSKYYDEYLGVEVEEKLKPAELLKQGARVPGAYNNKNTGYIEQVDPEEYFTANDIKAIREYYAKGGNLLLTTFSIELVYEFGVIPYNCWRFEGEEDLRNECRPFFHLFNEVKPSSIWFVRSEFGSHNCGSHPLYEGMFKCDGNTFPESKNDIQENSGDENYIYVGSDKDRTKQMYPLLSMGADACENNNVVWDFTPDKGHQLGKTMAAMEEQCNAKCLGTWGQRGDDNVGVIFEFFPGPTHGTWNHDHFAHLLKEERDLTEDWIKAAFENHGRCIAIGLGAYEFNNGLKYDTSKGVKNYYQSNVHRMTLNAINYLMTKPNNEK